MIRRVLKLKEKGAASGYAAPFSFRDTIRKMDAVFRKDHALDAVDWFA